jgi:basic membrane protein A
MTPTFDRRAFLSLAASLFVARPAFSQSGISVASLFAGKIDDRGFMQAGYDGLKRAEAAFGIKATFTQGIAPRPEELTAALRVLAREAPSLVIAHGGQNNAAAKAIAEEFPNVRFVVTQGNVTGANLASYEVLQEHSAFLAGVLAALTTRTGVVGHMSGIRVVPGLKGRAAYANGVAFADPKVKLLTNFSGNQDDNALSKKVALAMIDAGADVIFTMLNAGRMGAVEACREKGVQQIGNVVDWTQIAPEVFLGSAFADSGQALFDAVKDVATGNFKPGVIRQIGVESPQAVRLTMSPRVPDAVKSKLAALSQEIANRRREVSTEWSGPEFPAPG